MARTYYDDGSYIETLADGSTVGYNTAGIAVNKVELDGDYFQSAGYANDAREAAKLDQFVPNPTGGTQPWFERVAQYGLTRAIDANFGPSAVNKTSAGATYAGQNGKTYVNGQQSQGMAPGGMGWLPVALVAAVAFFAMG